MMTLDILSELIDIQTSCVQQRTTQEGLKLDWEVFNKNGDKIFILPKRFNEEEIFTVQKYAKKFEKLGFEAGEKYSNEIKDKEIKALENKFQEEFDRMREENDRIASMLDKYMLESIEDDEDPQSKIGIPDYMH